MVTALLKDLTSGVHQLTDAIAGGNFDGGEVQAIAAAEGNTFAKLLMEKERFKLRVYTTVLNEEQRQSADRLQQRRLDRIDHAVARHDKQTSSLAKRIHETGAIYAQLSLADPEKPSCRFASLSVYRLPAVGSDNAGAKACSRIRVGAGGKTGTGHRGTPSASR